MYHLQGVTVKTAPPWSKIVVTSQKADCHPQDQSKSLFVFTYKENVRVDFSDNSTITSDKLEIIFDSKQTGSSPLSRFKKITFKDNVKLNRMNQKARANSAELYLEKQVCKLCGDVTITQTRNKQKDVPLEIKTNEAFLNLKTQEIQLEGSFAKPVTTVIELGHLKAMQKKQRKKKKKKKS